MTALRQIRRRAPQAPARRTAEVFARLGRHCWYCGRLTVSASEARATDYGLRGCTDHVISRTDGGTDDDENLVPVCSRCNSIKGYRSLEAARPALLQARFGWPAFNAAQLDWLAAQGFDTSPITRGLLCFEERREGHGEHQRQQGEAP